MARSDTNHSAPWVRILSNLLLTIALGAVLSPPALAEVTPETLQEILIREHGRNIADGVLHELSGDADPAVRARAVRALGRIQDPASLDVLGRARGDSEVTVRREVAWALAQMETPEAIPHLMTMSEDPDSLTKTYAVEGLGKCGDENVVLTLSAMVMGDDAVQAIAAAKALGLLALRGTDVRAADPEIKDAAREAMRHGVHDANDALVLMSCFAIQRSEVRNIITTYRYLLQHPNPILRMYALKALAASRDVRNKESLFLPLLEDEDWRVRAEALTALSKTRDRTPLGRMSLALEDPNPNVQIAAARAMADLAYSDGVIRYSEWKESSDWRLRGEYLRNRARSSGAGALGDLYAAAKDPNWRLRVVAAQCMGEIGNSQAIIALEPLVTDDNPSVQAAAINALVEFDEAMATEAIRPGLKADDPIVIMSAANGAGQRLDRDALPGLVEAYGMLQSPYDTDAMTAILEAVGTVLTARDEDGAMGTIEDDEQARAEALLEAALEDSDPEVAARAAESLALVRNEPPVKIERPVRLPEHFDAAEVAAMEMREDPLTAVIETRKGSITLELYPDTAPFTVSNFVRLAREGFYDGLAFHRVVPNFVIQGGDPRGDGWGGPGYEITCEYSPRPYRTGALGMAHSGKDTAGSQFFITHSYMPHLEGRYTVFGQVVAGQEVVDNIQIGDVIQSIRFEGL